jgi:hypothetical protein
MTKLTTTTLIERLSLALVLTALSASDGQAATRVAASCSRADVQTAINAAVDGDTVMIPVGSCTWTSGIATNKQITISGQTKGAVLITHSAGSGDLLSITTGSSFSTKVSNLNFMPGTGTGRYMLISGSGRPPVVHDNYFRVPNFQLAQCMTVRRNGAVIHHNVFESLVANGTSGSGGSGSGCLQLKDESNGSSWSTASTMGTADTTGTANIYIEDNIFTNIYLQVIDCDDNARTVIRFNTFNNSGFVCHGADTSTFGARHTEVYNNTFIFTPAGIVNGVPFPLNLNWWWYVRGGTGIVTDNVMADIGSGTWGSKPEIQLTVQQLRRNAGPNACCSSYPCFHQVGQSHNGSSLTTDPLYIWNNLGVGLPQSPGLADYNPNECPGNNQTSSWVQLGRDYITGKPKPGYVKYTYPHPLVSTQAQTPSPPLNLRINR